MYLKTCSLSLSPSLPPKSSVVSCRLRSRQILCSIYAVCLQESRLCVLTINRVTLQAMREKADFLKSYEERLASLTQQSSIEQTENTKRMQQRTQSIRNRETLHHREKSSKAYQPFTGSKTTLQARLAQLAQNLDQKTASSES